MDAGKVSAERPVNFRPGGLRADMEELLKELQLQDTGMTLSDIVRDGLAAFWPQIRAYLKARQQTGLDPVKLAQLTSICAKAMELGVTVEEAEAQLANCIQQHLAV